MDICTSINKIKFFEKSILTIGVFDGLHLGHMRIIKKTSKISLSKKLPSVLITFHPHPKKILTKHNNPFLLIEKDNPDLKDILPKIYTKFSNSLLVELLRIMDGIPSNIEGDVFGKIYENFF